MGYRQKHPYIAQIGYMMRYEVKRGIVQGQRLPSHLPVLRILRDMQNRGKYRERTEE